ncbi:MAG: hypothetical protein NWE93_03255 [Candidatus Bathyarchaeota archaeon]|nr:hypothetical protein [Candidatus Bathyarchaeota archaeon]
MKDKLQTSDLISPLNVQQFSLALIPTSSYLSAISQPQQAHFFTKRLVSVAGACGNRHNQSAVA